MLHVVLQGTVASLSNDTAMDDQIEVKLSENGLETTTILNAADTGIR